jgi:hypothetical protein
MSHYFKGKEKTGKRGRAVSHILNFVDKDFAMI